jgi:hypothetical protein
MGWLVKIWFPYNTLAVRPLSHYGPYVRLGDRTSAPTSFRENLIFSSLFAYSLTPKANTNSLGSPNTYQNLHVKQQC